ncbi:MAG TPA: hypothetical protein VMX17_02710 [Candidatus Glassbacteria bacterium]|nr:hypothetical protein [Candidatus Glassbacteria bacterium]
MTGTYEVRVDICTNVEEWNMELPGDFKEIVLEVEADNKEQAEQRAKEYCEDYENSPAIKFNRIRRTSPSYVKRME